MDFCIKTSHPFLEESGQSQSERLPHTLDPTAIKIDDRDMGELLDFIYRFSWQVTYYNEKMEGSNWLPFFRKSLPFLIAQIQHIDISQIEKDLDNLSELVVKHPNKESLKSLFDYISSEMICTLDDWQKTFNENEVSFADLINNLIAGNLQNPLKEFISLYNGTNKWYCLGQRSFYDLQQAIIWGLDFTDLFAIDDSFQNIPGGYETRILFIKERLMEIAFQFLQIFQELKNNAAPFLKEVLYPEEAVFQKKHAPHLGLLFAFIQLFQKFQDNLNEISTRHLEFFYDQALNIQHKTEVPDFAHIVLELQKHIDEGYLIQKGTKIKDGKDSIGKDILFETMESIVLDKAQVKELKTLFLNPSAAVLDTDKCKPEYFVQGVYLAPVGNSADGLGEEDLEDGQSWSTLGSKPSKFLLPTTPPSTIPEDHPFSIMGLVLASHVLLLNEGDRTINITIKCKAPQNSNLFDHGFDTKLEGVINTSFNLTEEAIKLAQKEGLITIPASDQFTDDSSFDAYLQNIANNFSNNDKKLLRRFVERKSGLKIQLSGEDEWLEPYEVVATISSANPMVTIDLVIKLDPDQPPVTFYDQSILLEPLNTKLPVAKVLLDPEITIKCDTEHCSPDCCLEHCHSKGEVEISLYHFFRYLTIEDTCIEVEVCGLKNVIVQNDENVQDVNDLIFPFGTRPKLDASFYIGSREIFCKPWKDVYVNVTWKDRPADFVEHYQFYNYYDFEDSTKIITQNSFKFLPCLLNNGTWLDDTERPLFHHINSSININADPAPPYCPDAPANLEYFQDRYRIRKNIDFPTASPPNAECICEEQKPKDVDTREAFIRLMLKGISFQHDQFTYVLVRHMVAIADMIDPVTFTAIKTLILNLKVCADKMKLKLGVLKTSLEAILKKLNFDDGADGILTINIALDGVRQMADKIIFELNEADSDLSLGAAGLPAGHAHVQTAISFITPFNSKLNTLININLPIILNDQLDYDGVNPGDFDLNSDGIIQIATEICAKVDELDTLLKDSDLLKEGLPNEPYTPIIKDLSLDYCAKAEKTEIDLFHLYPCTGTFKEEDLLATNKPTLLPTFEDEGTLYLGIEKLIPGHVLNLLFQLAEATADPEIIRADVRWHYLRSNEWVELLEGFQILSDDTKGLTRSGIVQIAIPEDISHDDNTIMKNGLHWIKASARENVRAVAETIGIHTQAVKAVYSPGPENIRTDMLLPIGALAKLNIADTSIKSVNQFYPSFGGQLTEDGNSLYQRISERLRHKGRAITRFDYERILLDNFIEIWKAKCINHTLSLPSSKYKLDLELAPGFVLIAVIPDIDQLKVSDMLAPKVPLSLLEEIAADLKTKNSPFIRLNVMNPRYEGVCIEVTVRFRIKNPTFYKNKLREDIITFLAPWSVGNKEALCFGRTISKSELIPYIEQLDYVDYICEMKLGHELDKNDNCEKEEPLATSESGLNPFIEEVLPKTARSILTAGRIKIKDLERDCELYAEDRICEEKAIPVHTIIKKPINQYSDDNIN